MNVNLQTTTFVDFETHEETAVTLYLEIGVLGIGLELTPDDARQLACALISRTAWRGAGVIGPTLETHVQGRIDCPLLPWDRFGNDPHYAQVTEETFERRTDG